MKLNDGKKYKYICGIYKITNKINNKCYIGKTEDLYTRLYTHIHHSNNINLRNDIEKYGLKNFTWEVLESKIFKHSERYYIKLYNSIENGYNIQLGNRDPFIND